VTENVNPNALDESVLRFAMGWDSAVAARTAFALFGALVLILTIRVLWKRNCSPLAGMLWLLIGAVCVAFSIIPDTIVTIVLNAEYLTRIRFIMGGISILVLLITLESIRTTRLQERYALLWVVTALVLLLCAIFPRAVDLFRAVTGMHYETALASVALIFLALVGFHFSTAMSAMESDRDKIAQKLAVLEKRVEELESKPTKSNSIPRQSSSSSAE
jgi:hypothetical protein